MMAFMPNEMQDPEYKRWWNSLDQRIARAVANVFGVEIELKVLGSLAPAVIHLGYSHKVPVCIFGFGLRRPRRIIQVVYFGHGCGGMELVVFGKQLISTQIRCPLCVEDIHRIQAAQIRAANAVMDDMSTQAQAQRPQPRPEQPDDDQGGPRVPVPAGPSSDGPIPGALMAWPQQ